MKNDSKAIMLDNGLVVCESCGAELSATTKRAICPMFAQSAARPLIGAIFLWFFERRCFYERNADFLSLVRGCRLF